MTPPTEIPDGIDAVIVRPVLDPDGHRTPLVHVAWRRVDGHSTAAVQLYVDDELAHVELDTAVNDHWFSLDPHGRQRIDVRAVGADSPDDARQPLPRPTNSPADRVEVTVSRDPSLPIATQIEFEIDGHPVATAPMWGPNNVRGGFGSLFGLGSLGLDAASAVGLGLGPLGLGALDADDTPLRFRWNPPDLPPGEAAIRASFFDERNRPVAQASEASTTLDFLAPAVAGLRLDTPNTLAWNA